MQKSGTAFLMLIVLCLVAIPGWAGVYVSDKLEAPLRNGPGTQYRIVGMLRSGDRVEVLSEQEGWSHVRLVSGTSAREGWILSRYLMNREPWENKVQELELENAQLRETASPMAKELRDIKAINAKLQAELEEKTRKAEKLQKDYEALRKEASDFLALQERFETVRSDLLRVENELTKTTEENELLRSSHNHRWFLMGAGVLLLGLLIGLMFGKREKRRASKIYL